MKPTVYVESSVISYLTSDVSRDLIVAANQELTREWWETRRWRFRLFVSQVVVEEVRLGDKMAAEKRLAIAGELPILTLTAKAMRLAEGFMKACNLPRRATRDAFHIAVATDHGMDYLVTWNCAHIANAELRERLSATATAHGYRLPNLCTLLELMGA
jgi:hypothetical protein